MENVSAYEVETESTDFVKQPELPETQSAVCRCVEEIIDQLVAGFAKDLDTKDQVNIKDENSLNTDEQSQIGDDEYEQPQQEMPYLLPSVSRIKDDNRDSIAIKPSVTFDLFEGSPQNDLEVNERPTTEKIIGTPLVNIRLTVDEEARIAECARYGGVENFASVFIEDVVGKSVDCIKNAGSLDEGFATRTSELALPPWASFSFIDRRLTHRRWPKAAEFNREVGETTIDDYINSWTYENEWLYCIDFILEQSDACSDYYRYEVKWGIPTKPYPIPQATASVYFTIEVSRVKPQYCPVQITYVFEGSRFIHTAGVIEFQEYWLFNIIDAKMKMYKSIKF